MNTVNRRPRLVDTPSSKAIATSYFHQNEWKGICEDKNTFGVDQNTFAECENVYVDRDNVLANRPGLSVEFVPEEEYEIYSTKSYVIYFGRNSKIISVNKSVIELPHDLLLPEGFSETELYFYEIGNILFAFGNNGIYRLSISSDIYKLENADDNLYIPNVSDIRNLFIPNATVLDEKDLQPDDYQTILSQKDVYENDLLNITKQNNDDRISFPYKLEDLKYILLYNTSLTRDVLTELSADMKNSTFIVSEGFPYLVTFTSSYDDTTEYTNLIVKFNSLDEALYSSKTFTHNAIHMLFPDITVSANWCAESVRLIDFNKYNDKLYFKFNGRYDNTKYLDAVVVCDTSSIYSTSEGSSIFSAGKAVANGQMTILFDDNFNLYNIVHQPTGHITCSSGFTTTGDMFYQLLNTSDIYLISNWRNAIHYCACGILHRYNQGLLTLTKLYFYTISEYLDECYYVANENGYIRYINSLNYSDFTNCYFYKDDVYIISSNVIKKATLNYTLDGNIGAGQMTLSDFSGIKKSAFLGNSSYYQGIWNKVFIYNGNLVTRQFIKDVTYYPLISYLSATKSYDIFVETNGVWFFTDTGVYIYTTVPNSIEQTIIYKDTDDEAAKYSLSYVINGSYLPNNKPSIIRPIGNNSFLYFVNDTSYVLQVRYNNDLLKLYMPEGKENKYYDTVIDAEQTSDKSLVVIGNNVLYSVVDTGNVDDKQLPIFQYIRSKLNLRVIENSDSIIAYNSSTLLMPTYNGIAAVNYSQLIAVEEQTVNYITDNIMTHWFNFVKSGTIKTCNHNYYLFVYNTDRNDLYMFDYRSNTWWYFTFEKKVKLMHTIGLYCFIVFEDNTLYYFDEKVLDAQWSITSQKLYLGNNTNYKQIRRFTVHTIGEKSKDYSYQSGNGDNVMTLQFTNYRKRMYENDDETFNFNVDFVRTYVIRLNYPKVYEFQYKLSSNELNLKPLQLTGITIEYKVGGKVR